MTPLPLPEPPDERVTAVLDALTAARAELRDAERIVAMIATLPVEDVPPMAAVRQIVELQVAQHRVTAWQGVVDHVTRRAVSLGLQP